LTIRPLNYFPDLNRKTQKTSNFLKKLSELYKELEFKNKCGFLERDMMIICAFMFYIPWELPNSTIFFARLQINDVGTGGGFPGVPLAIMFSRSAFLNF